MIRELLTSSRVRLDRIQILQSACIVSLVVCDVSLTILMIPLNLCHVSWRARSSREAFDLLGCTSVLDKLVHEALAGGYDSAFMSQPGQCNWDLLLVAAAHAVGNDVHLVLSPEKIERGLGYADVAFDADDDAGQRSGGV